MGLYTRVGKRALDVTGAGLMAAVTAPVMGVIAVALWRTQGRPILFTQQRVGRDDRDFTIYKFRTMIRGASSQGVGLWFERNDPRIISGSRRARIARGSGTQVREVNELLKQFEAVRKMMKSMTKGGGKKGRRGAFSLPPGLGL